MDRAGIAAAQQWQKEVAAVIDGLINGQEFPQQDKPSRRKYARLFKGMNRQTVRQLPKYLTAISRDPDGRGIHRVVISVIELDRDGTLQNKLKKMYLHTSYLMDRYNLSCNAAVFVINDVLVSHKPPEEDDLSVEQERLLLGLHLDLIQKDSDWLNPALRQVVLDHADQRDQIYSILSTRKLQHPEDLKALLEEKSHNAIQGGIL